MIKLTKIVNMNNKALFNQESIIILIKIKFLNKELHLNSSKIIETKHKLIQVGVMLNAGQIEYSSAEGLVEDLLKQYAIEISKQTKK